MLNKIKKSTVKKLLPKRSEKSHKGQNGKVLIVGGSIDYYGAPILSALGAIHSGADLVYLYVPECNFDCSRSMYPDFIVRKYKGDFLTEDSVEEIVEFGKKCDSALIGPGLGERDETMKAVLKIVKDLHIPTVLDTTAMMVLKELDQFPMPQPFVITPHQNEFKHLVNRDSFVDEEDTKSIVLLRSLSMDLHINVLLKGYKDYVSSEEGVVEVNITGSPGMTVGGTGDVLAGVVASFLAQRLEPFDAARCAAYYTGRAGEKLRRKKGVCFSASDLAMMLPSVL
jgi:ADP-dependent NAD(P)H-hydrate dehydratase / NAD(P)H-hydrate epimerase